MTKKKTSNRRSADWAEAKHRCQLSDEEVGMAKELGILPHSLIKNIPSPIQPWKQSVKDWVRGLYEKKIDKAAKKRFRREQAHVYEEQPAASQESRDIEEERLEGGDDGFHFFAEPTDGDVHESNQRMQRRQWEFRRAADVVAQELSEFAQVQKVVLFGSVAVPLTKELPRFREYQNAQIALWHECMDVDLAIWLSDFDHLRALQHARSCALNELLETEETGVAHHQVEMFLMEARRDRYLGRLCPYGQCPNARRRDCSVTGCGQKRFLRQHEGFVFQPESLAPGKSVVLFDRDGDTNSKGNDGSIPF